MKKQIEDLGSIEITDNDYGPCTVAVRLVDGNVWMTQSQIARLFGVYEATVQNNLRAACRGGMLREGKVSLLHKQNQRTTLNLPSFGLQFQVVIEIQAFYFMHKLRFFFDIKFSYFPQSTRSLIYRKWIDLLPAISRPAK